jgi:5-enolpyruvylshikimate-3-phosphate synthase
MIDESLSSQTLTGIILASAGLQKEIEVSLYGDAVSRWYRDLTIEICNDCGWSGTLEEEMVLSKWEVKTPKKVEIPPEISLFPLSVLFDLLHGTRSIDQDLTNFRSPVLEATSDALSSGKDEVDLRDSSDIIAPCAAIMALGTGGEILGAPHARGKESDRIVSTAGLLSSFGMEANETDTGLKIPGGQLPSRPKRVFDCELDHRLAMTAGVLATKVGADLSGYEICDVTHPGFFEMIMANDPRI